MGKKRTQNIRVLVVHNSLSPYRIPLFQRLSQAPNFEFKFLFSKKIKSNRMWQFDDDLGFNYNILTCKTVKYKGKELYLWSSVKGFSRLFDIIVLSDHINIPELSIQTYAKVKGIPIIRWFASTENSLTLEGPLSRLIKIFLNRISNSLMVPGKEGKNYAKKTVPNGTPIYICNNVVDNLFFHKSRKISAYTIKSIKKKIGLHNTVITFVGRLISQKGLDVLLLAIQELPKKLTFSLLLIGEGVLLSQTTSIFRDFPNANYVSTGYVKPEELPTYYAISDIIVLPSHIDTWGMVINEAMAAGKPVICSTGAGASRDLIKHNQSGLIFEKGNHLQLAEQLLLLITNYHLRFKMVQEADRILEQYTIDVAANQFLTAVRNTADQNN